MNKSVSIEGSTQIKRAQNGKDFRAMALKMQTRTYYACENAPINIKSRHVVDIFHT